LTDFVYVTPPSLKDKVDEFNSIQKFNIEDEHHIDLFNAYMEDRDIKNKEFKEWLKENYSELCFDIEFEDLGHSFAEVLYIYKSETMECIKRLPFSTAEAAINYIKELRGEIS